MEKNTIELIDVCPVCMARNTDLLADMCRECSNKMLDIKENSWVDEYFIINKAVVK